MKKQSLISRITSISLLLVLMLSVTPKTLLHDLFADHNDIVACNDADTDGPCIHKQGFSCQQSDLVVPSVYLLSVPTALDYAGDGISLATTYYSPLTLNNEPSGVADRGPPSHV